MEREDLIAKVVAETGITNKDVDVVLNSILANIHDALLEGRAVVLPDFGIFSVTINRPNRQKRHPITGEIIKIHRRKLPTFMPSRFLCDALNANE